MNLEPKAEIEKALAKIAEIRDDVRVRVHLAGLDAKEEWRKLEDLAQSVTDRAKRDVTDASRVAATEAIQALERFRARLH